ncbi:MAG TPA: sulfatase, partial [Gemmatimonadetes bacterium]|nr:sulfatase [Gemmatimonadota bacterium]
MVLNAEKSHPRSNVQAISAKLWSAGFLSPEYSGVMLNNGVDPVHYLSDPDGVSREVRRAMLDGLGDLNRIQHDDLGSPETLA